jgi:hypothetical protein
MHVRVSSQEYKMFKAIEKNILENWLLRKNTKTKLFPQINLRIYILFVLSVISLWNTTVDIKLYIRILLVDNLTDLFLKTCFDNIFWLKNKLYLTKLFDNWCSYESTTAGKSEDVFCRSEWMNLLLEMNMVGLWRKTKGLGSKEPVPMYT